MKSVDILSSLKNLIESNPGIKVRELPALLKQLPDKMRPKQGADDDAVRSFLERHFKVFSIDGNDCVFVRPSSPVETELPPTDNLSTLCEVEGRISRVSSVYGFIEVDHPIETSIYFDIQHFENKRCKDLLSAGLREGDRVVVDACKCGTIDRVRPGYGFIAFGRGNRDSAFFLGRVVDRALTKSILNLTDVFTLGDKVCFDAEPDKKSTNRAKWKATKVWCDKGVVGKHDSNDVEGDVGEEQVGHDSDQEDYPAGRPDWEEHAEGSSCEPSIAVQSELDNIELKFLPSNTTARLQPLDRSTKSFKLGYRRRLLDRLLMNLRVGTELKVDQLGAIHMMRGAWNSGKQSVANCFRKAGFAKVATGDEAAPSAPAMEGVAGDEPEVSIYEGVRGTVVRALECIAAVTVKEGKVSREIEFTMDCFYKDGEVVLDDLNELLKKGDEVTLDYMVGRPGCKDEVVHCDLLWQGAKPREAPRLKPKEFQQRLISAGRSSRYAVAS
ncbi:hypothetical protein HPB48_006445 [Haemaphysalis longicornis]|uniref:DDE-1 domain-containing protein n=1 Tax=Haemaphysalis longicornis TaxID=44386 RepID=A0A9J6FKL6_HAELO|nr:hypothetical protein HPB48_006445 [Haemaphysalis longicornis]